MSDYIEREAALAVCQKEYEERLSMADWCGDTVAWNIGSAIKNMPAADVAPVRHGRWISTGAISCKCSECHHLELKTRTLEYAYCPACGALMDGKEDGHEAG